VAVSHAGITTPHHQPHRSTDGESACRRNRLLARCRNSDQWTRIPGKGNRLPFSDDPNPLQESRLAAFSDRQSRDVFANFQSVLWPRRVDHRHRGVPGTDVRYRRKMSGSAGLRSAAYQMPGQGCPSRPGPVRRQCQNRSLPSTFPCSPRSIETACLLPQRCGFAGFQPQRRLSQDSAR